MNDTILVSQKFPLTESLPMHKLPLITEAQAHSMIGKDRFESLLKMGFITPFGLKDLPSDLYDRKQVETGPIRLNLSYACNNGKRANKYHLAVKYMRRFLG